MSKRVFLCCVMLGLSVFVFSGCLSLPNSPAPRFYMLKSMDRQQISAKFDIVPGVIVAVGPIDIPEYQDRPQIVTMDKYGMLKFAQFDRWGESLDAALARLITDNLTVMLPGASLQMFPCNFAIPVTYRVIVDVVQLDSRLDKDIFLVCQWSIIDAKNRQMLLTKRSEFRQPVNPHNYFGLTNALSAASVSLSSEIAASLAELSKQPKAGKDSAG